MKQRKILIIEDDTELLSTTDGLEGVRLVDNDELDLILLDLTLPDVDGIDVLRHLRQRTALPIVIISGRTEEAERVVGLELGADDYMVNELLARIHVVLRRAEGTLVDTGLFKTPPAGVEQQEPAPPGAEPEALSAMDIEMDIPARRVWVGGEEVPLTRTELYIWLICGLRLKKTPEIPSASRRSAASATALDRYSPEASEILLRQ